MTASRLLHTYEDGLQIVTFDPRYREDFKRLNVAWLTRYFRIEPIDERVLSHPEEEILASGGEILFALLDGSVVGTVALKRDEDGVFEITKMAVEERWQGKGFGKRLLESVLEVARQHDVSRVILYSQRSLKAAVAMYAKSGFTELPLDDPRYSRCDVKMEMKLA